MGPSHFIACNDRTVYSWQFSSISQNVAAAVNSYKRGGDDIDSNDFLSIRYVVQLRNAIGITIDSKVCYSPY